MTKQLSHPIRYGRLIAPVVLILFAVGWYQFSVVYIQGANDQLIANNNYSVYVQIQQIQAYLSALLITTWLTVAAGGVVFVYYFTKLLRLKRP